MAYSTAIDKKWQSRWDKADLYSFDPNNLEKKLYCLEMFSYPSGANLHVGHWYNFGLADSWARMKRLQGFNVFHPQGFDAFGLPAENYAIQTGIHPKDSTLSNIATMEKQLSAMGATFQMSYNVVTCSPDYYRWTQWIFLQLLKHGLAYRKKAPVNWCPSCQTVLANEQVQDGNCERCQTETTKRDLTQWFFRITSYAQELLDGLHTLDWPEKTKKIQTNWIGRSEGAEIDFPLVKGEDKIRVFTTRADTLLGATYLVLAPENEAVLKITSSEYIAEVKKYIAQAKKASEIERMSATNEKTGVFTGSFAVHPVTGGHIPIWTADYVLAGYGTGCVMAVPAHDERDYQFAVKYSLPIERVISASNAEDDKLPYCEPGVLVNSGTFDGLSSQEGKKAIVDALLKKNLGEAKVTYRLRDWLVSRQRYWGSPIPVVHCDFCGAVPVPEEQLPVELPYDVVFKPDGESPLAKCESFINTTCPSCNKPAKRDVDTLDTFVCSSWYFLRYPDNRNSSAVFDKELINQMLPVDKYIGGAEHAAMHLLYARFVTKALRDMGFLNFDEPFTSLVHQGTILGSDGQKMSKSKGNTVAPDEYIEKHGSDVFRTYLAFGFAYTEGGPWSDDGIKSIDRFFGRIERLVDKLISRDDTLASKENEGSEGCGSSSAGLVSNGKESSVLKAGLNSSSSGKYQRGESHKVGAEEKELQFVRHSTIMNVTNDTEKFQFNTSIARLMELTNALYKYDSYSLRDLDLQLDAVTDLLKLLAPFAPHFTEEQWEKLGHKEFLFAKKTEWPVAEERWMTKDEVEMAVQINGQLKFKILVPSDLDIKSIESLVLSDDRFMKNAEGKEVKKIVIVKGRLVNVVVRS